MTTTKADLKMQEAKSYIIAAKNSLIEALSVENQKPSFYSNDIVLQIIKQIRYLIEINDEL